MDTTSLKRTGSYQTFLQNFEKLFAIHQELPWEENVARLVKETNSILPTGNRFQCSDTEARNILSSADTAQMLSKQPDYLAIESTLTDIVRRNEVAILRAAEIDNINERGNRIEQIITDVGNVHGVEDITFP